MARAAAVLLLDRPDEPSQLWFRGELVVRHSTGAAPTPP